MLVNIVGSTKDLTKNYSSIHRTTQSNITSLFHFTSINFLMHVFLYTLCVIPFITLTTLCLSMHVMRKIINNKYIHSCINAGV